MTTPDSLALFALKASPLPKGIRPEPGAYSVDKEFLIRVSGTFKVGADYEAVIAQSANPWLLLRCALSKLNGVTIDSIVRDALAIEEVPVADDACEEDSEDGAPKKSKLAPLDAAIKKAADDACASIKANSRKTCHGKVTKKLTVSVVVK